MNNTLHHMTVSEEKPNDVTLVVQMTAFGVLAHFHHTNDTYQVASYLREIARRLEQLEQEQLAKEIEASPRDPEDDN